MLVDDVALFVRDIYGVAEQLFGYLAFGLARGIVVSVQPRIFVVIVQVVCFVAEVSHVSAYEIHDEWRCNNWNT